MAVKPATEFNSQSGKHLAQHIQTTPENLNSAAFLNNFNDGS